MYFNVFRLHKIEVVYLFNILALFVDVDKHLLRCLALKWIIFNVVGLFLTIDHKNNFSCKLSKVCETVPRENALSEIKAAPTNMKIHHVI